MENSKKKKLKLNSGCFPTKPNKKIEKSEVKHSQNVRNDDDDDFMFDVKNEQLILGQALSSDVCLAVFSEYAVYDDFLVGNHKVIAFCILKAVDEGVQTTDDIFDIYRYDYEGGEKTTGGLSYISNLRKTYNDSLTNNSYLVHIRKLKSDNAKHKIQRTHIKRLMRVVNDPSSSLEDILTVSSNIEKTVSENDTMINRGFLTMAEVNVRHDLEVKQRGKDTFGSCGFRFVDDHLTEGFSPGRVSVVAGRPGAGKSSFVNNAMVRLGNKGIPNGLLAMEMDSVSTVDRMNAIETDIPLRKLIRDRHLLTPDELQLERSVKKRREGKPIYICDDVTKTLQDVKRELKKMVDKYGIRVCFIDLFMKLKKPKGMNNKSTTDQYTDMLNEIQRMSREVNVHVCVVVQIGRKVEARNDKRPVISDLKDSGAFEEVADLIILLYREAYYMSKNVEDDFESDVVEINIAKQRQGGTGVVKALFIGATTKIRKCIGSDISKFEKMVDNIKPKNKEKKKYGGRSY